MLAGADSSSAVLTPDMPSLALSTQVKVPGSEAPFPEHDHSQMGALIEGMKTCQSLWKEASDKAKHYKTGDPARGGGANSSGFK